MMYSYSAGEKVVWYVSQKLPGVMEWRTHRLYHLKNDQYLLILPGSYTTLTFGGYCALSGVRDCSLNKAKNECSMEHTQKEEDVE